MTKSIFGIVLLAIVAGSCGCGPTDDLSWYRDFYNRHCEQIAENYRSRRYQWVSLPDMEHYFQVRVGKMTVADLKRLLGEPRIVTPEDSYYTDALMGLYGLETVEDPNWHGGDKHDMVLHYGEEGPPHWIPDESSNLFFVVKNGIVVSVWVLA